MSVVLQACGDTVCERVIDGHHVGLLYYSTNNKGKFPFPGDENCCLIYFRVSINWFVEN